MEAVNWIGIFGIIVDLVIVSMIISNSLFSFPAIHVKIFTIFIISCEVIL